MDRKTLIIIISIVVAVIVAFLVYYFVVLKKPVAQVYGSETFILTPDNPSQSASITIPYGNSLSLIITLTNAKPNSVYTIKVNGRTYYLGTGNNGYNLTVIPISSALTSSMTVRVCITGPCIPSAYTLTLNITVPPTTPHTSTSTTSTTTTTLPNYYIVVNENDMDAVVQYISDSSPAVYDQYIIPANSTTKIPFYTQQYTRPIYITTMVAGAYSPPAFSFLRPGAKFTIPNVQSLGLQKYSFVNNTSNALYVYVLQLLNPPYYSEVFWANPGETVYFWAKPGWYVVGHLYPVAEICKGWLGKDTTFTCS